MERMEMIQYLYAGGWFQNFRGWWHPPNCSASWPLKDAYKMALEDEKRGLRMSPEEAKKYLEE